MASELEGRESQALRVASLMVILPPPPGFQPLPGAPLVDLMGQNLAQWADRVQEVASHMRLPPQVAAECPHLGCSWCARPTRGHDPSAILPALFWGRATVSMLGHPSSGSRPYNGLVDAPRSELHGYGLFHLNCWGDSLEVSDIRIASTGANGHVTSSHYGGIITDCRCQGTNPAADTHCLWPSSA